MNQVVKKNNIKVNIIMLSSFVTEPKPNQKQIRTFAITRKLLTLITNSSNPDCHMQKLHFTRRTIEIGRKPFD